MKVKNWAWDSASKFLSQIENDLISLKITKSDALTKMQNSDESLYLEGFNNSIDAEEWIDNIHFQYNMLETPRITNSVEVVIDNIKETKLENLLWGDNNE